MSGILFVGIARNVRRWLPAVLANLDMYGKVFGEHKVMIVENNSTDGTKEFFRTWAQQKSNRIHIEADDLPVLRNPQNPRGRDAPLLAQYRNLYMERIEEE